ncbi:C39 family peptidase [Reticulibacter mediterranei]|nr:C39 family peptidase [Reticulibacter mediterranei]
MEWNTLVGTSDNVSLSGRYCFPRKIPYSAQFASPELIHSYGHEHFDARQDPRWREFGAEDVEEYCFWCSRSCAIACLKMCIETLTRSKQPLSMFELIQQGLAAGGYIIRHEQGELVEFGWIYQPLVNIGQSYGLKGQVYKALSIENICSLLLTGALVIASVSDEIGKRNDTPITHKGGHMVLVHGFEWSNQGCQTLLLHNSSGRFPELQENAVIPYDRFAAAFAGRGFAFWSSDEQNE